MKLEIPALPYPKNALEPYISARTVEFHYEKHHRGYLRKLLRIVEGKPEAERSLEDLIRTTHGDLFNNAAQVWNHTFYWQSMKPGGGGAPTGDLKIAIDDAFGSYDRFKDQLTEAANGEFGSGWAWLVRDHYGRLRVQGSSDAENPLQRGFGPLLAIDVWEHAYYLDVQNDRARYVAGFVDHLLNWDFVAHNLGLHGRNHALGAKAEQVERAAQEATRRVEQAEKSKRRR